MSKYSLFAFVTILALVSFACGGSSATSQTSEAQTNTSSAGIPLQKGMTLTLQSDSSTPIQVRVTDVSKFGAETTIIVEFIDSTTCVLFDSDNHKGDNPLTACTVGQYTFSEGLSTELPISENVEGWNTDNIWINFDEKIN